MSNFSLHDIKYLSKEVHRQGDSAEYVYGMARALSYVRNLAMSNQAPKTLNILAIGSFVKNEDYTRPYRKVYVRVGDSEPIGYENIDHQIEVLLANWDNEEISDDEWYRQFEEIHPFLDGNGRAGSLLWNWRRGSLGWPEDPPNLWGTAQAQ